MTSDKNRAYHAAYYKRFGRAIFYKKCCGNYPTVSSKLGFWIIKCNKCHRNIRVRWFAASKTIWNHRTGNFDEQKHTSYWNGQRLKNIPKTETEQIMDSFRNRMRLREVAT